MNEKEKMLAGKIYDSTMDGLAEERHEAHELCRLYNMTPETDEKKRTEILKKLLPNLGEESFLVSPINFDYGINTKIGKRFFSNFNLAILDCAPVEIGDDVFVGPNVSIMTPIHPLRYQERNTYHNQANILTDREYAKPIVIGNNIWIASNVVITGGVHIGNGSVIAAGSVVTHDIPENVLAAGVPCKVIRPITEADSIKLKKDLW
jgi:maltose O-acetyltransferase